MMKTKVYIFNSACRGAAYGVGTYIEMLTSSLENTSIEYGIVNLFSEAAEPADETKNGHHTVNIPKAPVNGMNGQKKYARSVAYLLSEFITVGKETKLVFHLNFMTEPYLVAYLKRLFPKCKVVLVAHYTNWSFTLMGDEAKLLEIVDKPPRKRTPLEKAIVSDLRNDIRMINKVDKFVCVANHTLDTFRKVAKIDMSKCMVVNNALRDEYVPVTPEARQELRKKYRIGNDETVILYVGRLDYVKGIRFLLESFNQVLEKIPAAHLFLVGEGDFAACMSWAKTNWSHVSFTGRLSRDQVFDFYKLADVGVVCSLHEEFGLVATEMMMNALPMVATDTGGLAEIVDQRVTGVKIPVVSKENNRIVSTEELADAICELATNKPMAHSYGEHARSKFLEKYEQSLFTQKMINLYNSL